MKGIIKIIARKEFIEITRDNRFRVTSTIIFLLLTLALVTGLSRYRDIRNERINAVNHMREVWLNQGEKDPHLAAHFGTFVFRPVSNLSLIDPGIESYTGTSIFLEAHRMNNPERSPIMNTTNMERFGVSTVAFVIQLLMPLLITILSFSAYSGERESGTLQQIAASGIKPGQLLKGKLLGVGSSFTLCAAPASIMSATALTFLGGEISLYRTVGLLFVYALWLIFYFLISFILSIKIKSSKTCLIALLAFWGWNVMIAPGLLSGVAMLCYPTLSLPEFNRAIDVDTKGKGQNLQQVQLDLLKIYRVTAPDKLPVNVRGILHQRNEEISNQIWDKHFSSLWNQYDKQERLIQWLGIVAPLNAVRSISMSLAGTDFKHQRLFLLSAETYRRNMVQKLNLDLAYNSRTGKEYKAKQSLWQSIPDFTYPPPLFKTITYNQLPSITVLICWLSISTFILIKLSKNHVENL